MAPNPYDVTPYQSYAYGASHPSRLAVVARLFGLETAALETARVLEIGCASGGNLLPMAASQAQAHFVGLDYSPVQIDLARKAQAELGLTNIAFHCVDIRSADAQNWGVFDYVIAHGIYSWLAPDAQAALLALCRHSLAPQGIAYVSYNTLPGWHMRGIIRDMMLFHSELFPDPGQKVVQAKALLDFMATQVPTEGNPYGQYLRHEMQLVSAVSDSYLSHDHLEEHNEALYFRDFVTRAHACGLAYLGESEFSSMVGAGVSNDAYQQLASEIQDIVRLEQYLDFMRNRTFRMTLLVQQGRDIRRKVDGDRLQELWVSGALVPDTPCDPATADETAFRSGNGHGLRTGHPITKAALLALRAHFPGALAFSALLSLARSRLPSTHCDAICAEQDATTLANDLLLAYMAPGTVQLYASKHGAAPSPGPLPTASAYARWQALHARVLTNLMHETVEASTVACFLLPLLDGGNDHAALCRALRQGIAQGQIQLEHAGQTVSPDAPDAAMQDALSAVLQALALQGLLLQPA